MHYSGDYFHNIWKSECVHDPLNQLITVDNRDNLRFDNLGQAVNAGLDRADRELVVVVHEDVLLPKGWHRQFELALAALEQVDPDWGLVGCAGWMRDGRIEGHWSDPNVYMNTLGEKRFEKVDWIDEHLMLIRKSSGLRLDDCMPSIHHIGRDLSSTLRLRGLETYVVDAPTIHKFADAAGKPILTRADSPKITARALPSYAADMRCCEDYLYRKWPQWRPADFAEPDDGEAEFRPDVSARLDHPVVLLSRGGSGSRLLSWLAMDAGLWLGNDVSISGDALEMVEALYMALLNGYQHRAEWQKQLAVPQIRMAAARMLERGPAVEAAWGFKLPECMLLVAEIDRAFPRAQYVHLIRDPLTTCLRRTHMTARPDSVVGRLAIRLAYRYCGRDLERSLDDPPAVRMAYTTIHQIETARRYAHEHWGGRYRELRFEDLLAKPSEMPEELAHWLGLQAGHGSMLAQQVDPDRAARPADEYRYGAAIEAEVAEILAPLRRRLGYLDTEGCDDDGPGTDQR